MGLSEFVAEKRKGILDRLSQGEPPSEGEFDEGVFKDAVDKGPPQIGATRFEPDAVVLEFIYPDPLGAATILSVRLKSPERIVFLPVPSWVVESIWQGSVDGTFRFESEARKLVEELDRELGSEANRKWFEPRTPVRRE